MSNYYTEVFDQAANPPDVPEDRIRQALNWMRTGVPPLHPEDDFRKEATSLMEDGRIRAAESVISSDMPAVEKVGELQALADYDPTRATALEVESAVYDQLVSQESSSVRASSFRTRNQFNEHVERTRKIIDEAIEQYGTSEGKFELDSPLAETTLEVLDSLIPLKYTTASAALLAELAPGTEYGMSREEMKAAIRDNLRKPRTPEETKALVDRTIANLKDVVGIPGTDNELFGKLILQEVIGGLQALEPNQALAILLSSPQVGTWDKTKAAAGGLLSNTLTSDVIAALDVMPVVGRLVRGARTFGLGLSDAFKLMRDQTPFDFMLTEAGSKVAAEAASAIPPTSAETLGVSPAQVVAAGALPRPVFEETGAVLDMPGARLRAKEPDEGRPTVAAYFLPQEAREAQLTEMGLDARRLFGLRLNETDVVFEQGGIRMRVGIGQNKGTGFPTKESASAWATAKMGDSPWTVEQMKTGEWQIRMEQFKPYRWDAENGALPFVKNGFAVGRGSVLTDWLNQAISTATRVGDMAQAEAKELSAPFYALGRESSERVQQALVRGDAQHAEWTIADMHALGLDSTEMKALLGIRKLSKQLLSAREARIRGQMVTEGWAEATIGQTKALVKPMSRSLPSSATKVYDLAAGRTVPVGSVPQGSKLWHIMDNLAGDTLYGFTAPGVKLGKLPSRIFGDTAGWMPRIYNASHVVRYFANGRWNAWKTARSEKAGNEEVMVMGHLDPNVTYKTFQARELAEELETAEDIIAAREQGLLYTSARRDQALRDVEGDYAMMNTFEAVQQMAGALGMEAGIRTLTTALKPVFKARFGWEFDLAQPPPKPSAKDSQALHVESDTAYRYLRMINGLELSSSGHWAPARVRYMWNRVADWFYNRGTDLRRAQLEEVGAVSDWFGDNISGLKPSLIQSLKTLAFAKFMVLNPPVQWFVQTGAMFTHWAMQHGTPYFFSGRAWRDILILEARSNPKLAEAIGLLGGAGRKYTQRLLQDAVRSGIDEAVDGHIMRAGTYSASRIGSQGLVGQSFAVGYNALRRAGFDFGTRRDKRMAWLMSRNKAIVNGKNMDDPRVLEEVANDAEAWTTNANRSDPLVAPDGMMSAVLQFAGVPIKYTQRLVGGAMGLGTEKLEKLSLIAPGSHRKWAETGFTAGEQTRHGLATLFMYGMGGFGVGELAYSIAARVESATGEPVPEPVVNAIREGVQGTIVNTMVRAAFDKEGENTQLAYSERFSPYTQIGMYTQNMKTLVSALLNTESDDLAELAPSAASLGLVGDLAKMVDRAYHLTFHVPEWALEDKTKASILAMDAAKQFPIVSNYLKFDAGMRLLAKVDSRGSPIVQATRTELAFQLLGVKSLPELDYYRLSSEVYGTGGLTHKGMLSEVQKQVDHDWSVVTPILDKMANGEYNMEQGRALIEGLALHRADHMDPDQLRSWEDGMKKRLLRGSDQYKDERLYGAILDRLDISAPNSSFRSVLEGSNYKYKDKLLDEMDRSFRAPAIEVEDGGLE